ncbi:uncharacterized protein LOC141498776 [Macrotis lagotis]|uniref:uncharacterized protein LOC141498776 n=1 Tax=Macrotis lagotis TaxID=92651 RepID=UPI003D69CB03
MQKAEARGGSLPPGIHCSRIRASDWAFLQNSRLKLPSSTHACPRTPARHTYVHSRQISPGSGAPQAAEENTRRLRALGLRPDPGANGTAGGRQLPSWLRAQLRQPAAAWAWDYDSQNPRRNAVLTCPASSAVRLSVTATGLSSQSPPGPAHFLFSSFSYRRRSLLLGAKVSKLLDTVAARRLKAATPPDGTTFPSYIWIPCIPIFVGLILIVKLTHPNSEMTINEGFQGNFLNKTDCKLCLNLTGLPPPEAYKRFQHYEIFGKYNTGNFKETSEYIYRENRYKMLGRIPGKSTALPPLIIHRNV